MKVFADWTDILKQVDESALNATNSSDFVTYFKAVSRLSHTKRNL